VEIINKTWLHDSGVVIRCSRENELVRYSSNSCPECSIRGPLGKRKLSHAKTVFCTMQCRLCVMSGIFRIPA
ncbi:TPA: hypothetical protein MFX66_26035, partial [Klebsiella pneumoniae]|nr:hypothetical protein [Klebsiella pneumoniae]